MSTINNEKKGSVPVLLLKTKSTPNDGYEEQFSQVRDGIEFTPTFVPVLEHKFLDDGMNVVQSFLQENRIGRHEDSKYGGMIFTSQRAVEAFAKLVDEGKDEIDWTCLCDVPIYTVGPATSRALKSLSQERPLNIFGAECGNGEALAHYMLHHYGEWYKDRPIKPSLLFLVGEQRRDIIPKTLMCPDLPANQRIQVDELVVYGTGVMGSFEEDFKVILNETKWMEYRWVVVFSPTGCEAMLRVLGWLDPETCKARTRGDGKIFVITIGPTTRDYLRNTFGVEPDVCAAKPSPEGLEDGILNYMSQKS
ncbi:tetrapyrrole biosynthesis, uroporphyrinogen III synthase [Amylocarpus encephaloides]|uniref:Tetrapyrrole biosynthesis, uroporphyrinogen III synthase n=1 Tax=Amylocarpus encephaloides TaxID=45428 RepID=A0A9P7Y8P8_9HELO|nr:tetrapyrrole biosynthesis, uroporphyrinogen III synthase [Amylocarpus encephaloides]